MMTKVNTKGSPTMMIVDNFFKLLVESDDFPDEIVDKLRKVYEEGKLSNASQVSNALTQEKGEEL